MIKSSIYEEKIQCLENRLETLRPVLDRLQTELSDVKRQRDYLRNRVKEIEAAYERQRMATAFWQGKFATIKHENNRLRRKVREEYHAGG